MSVPPRSFRDQLGVLEEMGITLLRLADVNRILDGAPAPARGVLVTFDDGYRNTVDTALPLLDERRVPAVVALCASYVRPETRPATTVHVSQDFADASEIEAWLATGRDIAGHSYGHPKLTALSEPEITREIAEDKMTLEHLFGRAIDTFVYPFGAADERVEQIVGRYYQNAFADARGSVPSRARRLAIRRTRVRPEWSAREFREHVERELGACAPARATAAIAEGG
ncbi:polysaccharide deacetylase family protein [Minicystis rosea]|nr:polysaccharide deacetylase family protein [Minicystis rosea]